MLTAIKNNQSFLEDMLTVIIINILICNIFPSLARTEIFSDLGSNVFYRNFFMLSVFSGTFFEGIVFAKYDALASLKKKIKEFKCVPLEKILSIFGVFIIFWCRMYIGTSVPFDIIYCPFFIAFVSAFLDDLRVINKMFLYLGKHSANMWYFHSFYCYYFLEITKIVYLTKNVWIGLFLLTVMSLATSVLLESIYKMIGKLAPRAHVTVRTGT